MDDTQWTTRTSIKKYSKSTDIVSTTYLINKWKPNAAVDFFSLSLFRVQNLTPSYQKKYNNKRR